MKLNEIRQNFLNYFKNKEHIIVKSSSLIPHNDPTLLFTNAGMNQFKDVFLGLEKRDYVRAASSQKCVRAGGKHNDLENVGYTARHHTFFEMLGNFSFGNYFKLDAIKFAWEFLTQTLKISKDRLYVTVYATDDEAYTIWHTQIGLAPERIIRIGDKPDGSSDNFWQMGETGPCGPCTEIFYDHGDQIAGGLPGSATDDGDRFVEIWNCVFMQFNRDEHGVLHPLPQPSVDTGMGLERIAAVMQGVHNNYDIDLFKVLISKIAHLVNTTDLHNTSLKVIADHIRSISFLIADGVSPANEGRGYVLRRIIRRAILHGYKLDMRTPFLYKLVDALASEMGESYPELLTHKEQIEQVICQEEEKFFQTIDIGMKILYDELNKLKQPKVEHNLVTGAENLPRDLAGVSYTDGYIRFTLDGATAFKLYDTYGFPLDLTENICREHNIMVDIAGFDICMQKQKNMAKAASKFKSDTTLEYNGGATIFRGYTENSITTIITAIYHNNQATNTLNSGEDGIIVLDETVFYAQSGGQVGDIGVIQINGGIDGLFEINDTQKIRSEVIGHIGRLVHGSLKVGDKITATFDLHYRRASARNHSATHLLHKALHEVVGTHAIQKGSLVCSDYTRFDFAHDKPLSADQIEEIERIVNHVIMMNYPVTIETMPYAEAIKHGALALFGEKYTDNVRVIQMGSFSTELCGGTHVTRTGDIGFFTITSETGIANGIRRIEAITGETALKRVQKNMAILDNLRDILKAQTNDIIVDKVKLLNENNRELRGQIDNLKAKLAIQQATQYLTQAEKLANDCWLLVLEVSNTDNKILVELLEQLKHKLGRAIVVIGCKNSDRVNLVVGVSSEITSQYHAGNIIKYLAPLIDGKGGGNAQLAQAGGINAPKLTEALAKTREYIKQLATIDGLQDLTQ
ncbi:MAG: alanine--tRNA ligase [Burkholderiales bacterium]|nr:alanine--tRNA ligase [Burkholderiales bacterium]